MAVVARIIPKMCQAVQRRYGAAGRVRVMTPSMTGGPGGLPPRRYCSLYWHPPWWGWGALAEALVGTVSRRGDPEDDRFLLTPLHDEGGRWRLLDKLTGRVTTHGTREAGAREALEVVRRWVAASNPLKEDSGHDPRV